MFGDIDSAEEIGCLSFENEKINSNNFSIGVKTFAFCKISAKT